MDAKSVRDYIVDELAELGYENYGADPADFAAEDKNTRFKVGTARGEVTVTSWLEGKCVDRYRATDERHLPEIVRWLKQEAK